MPRITFFLRSNNDKQGSFVLYCRVTFNGSSSEFSLKEKIDPGTWNQTLQQYSGTIKKTRYINTLLETIMISIKTLALSREFATAKDLVYAFRKPQTEITILANVIEKYISAVQSKVSAGTLRNHDVKLRNLLDYQSSVGREFTCKSFGIVEAEKFKKWFMERARTKNVDTANRNILFYRQAMLHARKSGSISDFELINYRGEKDPVKDPVVLSMEDLEAISTQSFTNKMLSRIRDLFLFQCSTGLSYADLWNAWEIKITEAGKILTGKRAKSNQVFFVPLNALAEQILLKYEELPKYDNAVYNRVLKEIAAFCGIDKRITTHTARKTFATIKDAEGWSRETVAVMLGHRSIRTTETYYIGVGPQRLEQEMIRRRSEQSGNIDPLDYVS